MIYGILVEMLPELAPLPRANVNAASGQEATVAILPKNMPLWWRTTE